MVWRRAGQKCAHCPSAGLSDAFLLFFWACGFVGGRPQREIALLITSCQGCSLNTLLLCPWSPDEVCPLGVTTEEFLFLPHLPRSPRRGDPHLWPTLKEGLVSLLEGRASTYVPSGSFTQICLFSSFLYLFSHFYISMDSWIPIFTLCFHLRASLLFILLLKLFQPQAWELLYFVSLLTEPLCSGLLFHFVFEHFFPF